MKYGSLFSGAGLGDFGFEMAGLEVAWQVEINDYAQKVLNLRWPNVKKYRDIKTVKPEDLEPVSLITGGFPCQDLSYAGSGEGISGSRSGLWKEYLRFICGLRPRWVVVENVPGLLSRGLDVVLRDLATRGYDAQWDCLPSAAFGAPHLRDRVWIVAYPRSEFMRGRKIFTEDSGNTIAWWKEAEKWGLHRLEPKMGTPFVRGLENSWKELNTEPRVCRMVDGCPDGLDRLRVLGNGQTPCSTYVIGKWILEIEGLERKAK